MSRTWHYGLVRRVSTQNLDTNWLVHGSRLAYALLPVVFLEFIGIFFIPGLSDHVWLVIIVLLLLFSFTVVLFIRYLDWRWLKLVHAARERRLTLRDVSVQRGWRWEDVAPPPALEVCEAVAFSKRDKVYLRFLSFDSNKRMHGLRLATVGLTQVVSGMQRGYGFTAAHLIAYTVGYESRTVTGTRADENFVSVELPSLLPEVRIIDTQIPESRDFGLMLPQQLVSGLPPRWRLEGFSEPFLRDLLSPNVIALLQNAPPRCTIVIRAGNIICSGDLVADADSVLARLEFLIALIENIPEFCWQRADADVAGFGMTAMVEGWMPLLDQAKRSDGKAWTGNKAFYVPWELADDLHLLMHLLATNGVISFPAELRSKYPHLFQT